MSERDEITTADLAEPQGSRTPAGDAPEDAAIGRDDAGTVGAGTTPNRGTGDPKTEAVAGGDAGTAGATTADPGAGTAAADRANAGGGVTAGTGPDTAAGAEAGTRATDLGPLLGAEDTESFRRRWQEIQTGFVDEPREAVQRGDGLVAELMQQLAATFRDERESLEAQWSRGDDVSTEDLRVALQRYRSFFERLLST